MKELRPEDIAIYARNEKKLKKWVDIDILVRIGDFNNTVALHNALKDVLKLLLIPTNDGDSYNQHKNVIDACIWAKVARFYYASGSVNHHVETSQLGF